MVLNQYKISCKANVNVEPIIIIALSKDSAWNKFVTQRFGALKPSKRDWSVKLSGSIAA